MSRRPGRGRTPRAPAVVAAPPVPATHPAMVVALLATALFVLFSVTFLLFDTDFWQHLLVGKAIWQTHSIPVTQLWTWPTYGAPDVNASWGFRALIWPFWVAGGATGLFAWRWLSSLAVFALLWITARRMGARGFAALLAMALCALVYRLRSQIRPETLVAVLLALQIWILETRRQGGRDRVAWCVTIAWIWANAHISWYLGFAVMGAYGLDDLVHARRDSAAAARLRRLAWTALAALAISFVNPWGWRALWQPFEYQLVWRNEPIYRTIVELNPVDWTNYLWSPLLGLMVLWPLLIAWRGWSGASDRAELALCLGFTVLALSTQRFIGIWALVATPFLMRGLDAFVTSMRWPAWTAPPGVRAAFVVLACAGLAASDARRVDPPPGVGIDWERFPVRACDVIASEGIRGRGFNNFEYGGYQAWRFWPDRSRLPFIDVHQAGTTLDRKLYVDAFNSADGWRALDARHHFDYVLLTRAAPVARRLPDILDADSSWALVFADDAATLYVRRAGPLAGVAARLEYHLLTGGDASIAALGEACARDTVLRARVKAELQRAGAASPWHATAMSLLANVALQDGRYDEGSALLNRALAIMPGLKRAHERLGLIALEQGRSADAVREFQREREQQPLASNIAVLVGRARQQAGDFRRARDAYRDAARLDPGDREAADSLASAERRAGP